MIMTSLTKQNNLNVHILKALHLGPKIRIMEINGGKNTLIVDVLNIDHTIRYFGLEHNASIAKELSKKYKTYIDKRKALYCDSDSENIPYGPNFFHRIVYSNPVQLKSNPSKVFNEVFRVLSVEGFFILTYSDFKDSEQLALLDEAKRIGFEYIHKKVCIQNFIDFSENGKTTEQVLMVFKKPNRKRLVALS